MFVSPSRASAAVLLTVMVGSLAACAAEETASAPSESTDSSTVRMADESGGRGVQVRNSTDQPVTLRISGTDNFDWEGSRPDGDTGLLEGAQIAPGESVSARLTVNKNSQSAPFTINVEGLDTSISVELDTDLDISENWDEGWFGWKKRGEGGCYDAYVDGGRQGMRPLTWTVGSGGYTLEVEERCAHVEVSDNTVVTIAAS